MLDSPDMTENEIDATIENCNHERIKKILGEHDDEIIRNCLYYHDLHHDKTWIRRQVDSIEFESDRTIKRKHSIDIDFEEVNTFRERYAISRDHCYLPIIERLERSPFLNVDLHSRSISDAALARRYENATLGAARIVGSLLIPLIRDEVLDKIDKTWLLPMISHLVEYERHIGSRSNPDDNDAERTSFADFVSVKALKLPTEVESILKTSHIELAFLRYRNSYTLYIHIPCKTTANNNDFTPTDTETIGTIKFTRYERADITDRDSSDTQDALTTNRRRLSPLVGTEYVLTMPLFGQNRNRGGLHTRIICPTGMTFDSVSVFQGNEPFRMERQPAGCDSSKHWSLHYGYIKNDGNLSPSENDPLSEKDRGADSETELGEKAPRNQRDQQSSSFEKLADQSISNGLDDNQHDEGSQVNVERVALEMIYNRRRAELHDLCLPPAGSDFAEDGRAEPTPAMWQVRVKMSSSRAKFLVPALGLLTCTMFALSINIFQLWRTTAEKAASDGHQGISTISSVSTLSLPLLLGFLVVGDEHLVLSQALGNLRRFVGATTACSVITACTLSVLDKNSMTLGLRQGRVAMLLYSVTILLGMISIALILIHIRRIQRYRTPAFEYLTYLKDRAQYRVLQGKPNKNGRRPKPTAIKVWCNLHKHGELGELWSYRRKITRQMLSLKARFGILFVILLILTAFGWAILWI